MNAAFMPYEERVPGGDRRVTGVHYRLRGITGTAAR
jgi:hypothetical protein